MFPVIICPRHAHANCRDLIGPRSPQGGCLKCARRSLRIFTQSAYQTYLATTTRVCRRPLTDRNGVAHPMASRLTCLPTWQTLGGCLEMPIYSKRCSLHAHKGRPILNLSLRSIVPVISSLMHNWLKMSAPAPPTTPARGRKREVSETGDGYDTDATVAVDTPDRAPKRPKRVRSASTNNVATSRAVNEHDTNGILPIGDNIDTAPVCPKNSLRARPTVKITYGSSTPRATSVHWYRYDGRRTKLEDLKLPAVVIFHDAHVLFTEGCIPVDQAFYGKPVVEHELRTFSGWQAVFIDNIEKSLRAVGERFGAGSVCTTKAADMILDACVGRKARPQFKKGFQWLPRDTKMR